MINFRYHVVSLTAVFLALAIGIVVGTAVGNGPIADALNDQLGTFHKQNGQLRDQINELSEEVDKQEQAWSSAASVVLPGRLAGRRVLVVSMPSSGKYVDRMIQLLGIAGAKVTSRVQLDDKFTDPASNEQLLDLALNAAPPGVRGALPSHSNGVETSIALLAAVLVGGSQIDGTKSVISAYQSQGFIVANGDSVAAEAVIFLAGIPYTENDAAKRNAAVFTVAERLDTAGRVVVTTPSSVGTGNVVRAVRDHSTLTKTISTVDNTSTELGRFSTVLALMEQIDGRTGHYGVGGGASGPMPQPTGNRNGA